MRTFIAVEISEEARGNITKIQKELPSDKIKIVNPELIHITLKFLGETDEKKIPEMKKALASIKFSPIMLKCKGAGVFPNPNFIKVVWVGVTGNMLKDLEELSKTIEIKMMDLGFEKNDYPFSPHITIGRPRSKVEISEFLEKYKDVDFGSFTVTKIKLKKSTLTPKGPIYEDL
jgi:2'-5' RNA ligase